MSPTRSAGAPASGLPLAALRRARLHAELAGMDPLHAARAVARAQRRSADGRDPTQFWHALYVELAPLESPTSIADRCADALAALPLEARTALLLRLGESMATPAISEVLDEPEARARAHLALAMARLREALAAGRSDALWLEELSQWLHQHEPVAARLQRPAPGSRRAVSDVAKDTVSKGPPRRPLRLWLALALALALGVIGLGLFQLAAEHWPLRSAGESAKAASGDPLEALLGLADADYDLLASVVDLDQLARLDFYLWLDATPAALADTTSPAGDPFALRTPTAPRAAGDRQQLWQALGPPEQSWLLQRLQQWQALGLAQQTAARLNVPHWQALGAAGRERLLLRQAHYLRLGEMQRAQQDAAFEALSPAERRALLPALNRRGDAELARELFTFLPADQLDATLDLLAALDDEAHEDLRRVTRRLPPWQREALRVELLQVRAADRPQWLRERLQRR